MKTPNCKLCNWKVELIPFDKKEKFTRPGCSAQGWIDCARGYNTKECRKLFIIKELEK